VHRLLVLPVRLPLLSCVVPPRLSETLSGSSVFSLAFCSVQQTTLGRTCDGEQTDTEGIARLLDQILVECSYEQAS